MSDHNPENPVNDYEGVPEEEVQKLITIIDEDEQIELAGIHKKYEKLKLLYSRVLAYKRPETNISCPNIPRFNNYRHIDMIRHSSSSILIEPTS